MDVFSCEQYAKAILQQNYFQKLNTHSPMFFYNYIVVIKISTSLIFLLKSVEVFSASLSHTLYIILTLITMVFYLPDVNIANSLFFIHDF